MNKYTYIKFVKNEQILSITCLYNCFELDPYRGKRLNLLEVYDLVTEIEPIYRILQNMSITDRLSIYNNGFPQNHPLCTDFTDNKFNPAMHADDKGMFSRIIRIYITLAAFTEFAKANDLKDKSECELLIV